MTPTDKFLDMLADKYVKDKLIGWNPIIHVELFKLTRQAFIDGFNQSYIVVDQEKPKQWLDLTTIWMVVCNALYCAGVERDDPIYKKIDDNLYKFYNKGIEP